LGCYWRKADIRKLSTSAKCPTCDIPIAGSFVDVSGQLSPGPLYVRVHILPAVKTRETNARVALLLAGEGRDERVHFLLIRTLAAGVDARTGGVTDPQYDLVRPRRVVDQHRGRIKGIEIPTLVEGPID
jgi:hypothetical protein